MTVHPIPPTTVSRRGLLAGAGLVSAALAAGGGSLAWAAGARAAQPLGRSAWTPLVGEVLAARVGDRRRRVRIVAVDDLGREGSRLRDLLAGREDAFALTLALSRPHAGDLAVTVAHPRHGAIPLFAVASTAPHHIAIVDRRTA
ncbi:MAG: hypothetical protein M0P31_10580 [Solirubrobacteraceae bacterium]|nr:hypothetical protein [Solirubrobacteraceae bacterium]